MRPLGNAQQGLWYGYLLNEDRAMFNTAECIAFAGKVQAPLVLLAPYYFLCWCLDVFFEDRPLARFWFLETVARMPYFSYVSMLHLYGTSPAIALGTSARAAIASSHQSGS